MGPQSYGPLVPGSVGFKSLTFVFEKDVFLGLDTAFSLVTMIATLEEMLPLQVVATAEDADGALRWMRTQGATCDLMIIDMFLASGSGLAVLRSAQALNVQARRIVLTNYATPDIRRRCTALGADRVFDKSSQIEDLLDYCISISDGTAAGSVQLH